MADSRLRLRFWGVRGSTPTPQVENLTFGGNTSCVEIRTADARQHHPRRRQRDPQSGAMPAPGSGRKAAGREAVPDAFPLGPYPGDSVFRSDLRSEEHGRLFHRRQRQAFAGDAGRPDGEALFPGRFRSGGGEADVYDDRARRMYRDCGNEDHSVSDESSAACDRLPDRISRSRGGLCHGFRAWSRRITTTFCGDMAKAPTF